MGFGLDSDKIISIGAARGATAALACLLLLAPALAPAADSVDSTFAETVQPILNQRCGTCHSEAARTSGFSVATRADLLAGGARHGAAVTPGHPEQSVLLRMIRGDLAPRMPLGAEPLPESELKQLEDWIRTMQPPEASDADSRPWWSQHSSAEAKPPAVNGQSWARNEIDRFVLAKLEQKELEPSPEASSLALLRRVFFDLIGIPPTPDEARQFLDDPSPDAYEKLVNRLLEDPRYGERWGRHWLDLARYADSMGFEADRELYHMWRYRDWVIEAFNSDKPYDEFVKEQLAGDEMAPKSPAKQIATGFLRVGPVYQTTIVAESRQLSLNELTTTTGSVFLGLTVGCAQCHDHKYDPIPQKDFYRLQAFFTPSLFKEIDLPFGEKALAERMAQEKSKADKLLEEKGARLEEYEKVLLAKWEAACSPDGCGDEKITAKGLRNKLLTAIANALVPNDDDTFSKEDKLRYLDLLDYVDGSMGGRDLGLYRRQAERHKPRAHVVESMAVSRSAPLPPAQFVKINGDYDHPGEMVEPGFLSAISGDSEPARLPTDQFGNVRSWRIALANWIASKENPLTARVMVNRIWQKHFGRGLVATPSDFGRNGAKPTHPELLDWLAARFVDEKWSIKAMHRVMLTSATYRQSSQHPNADAEKTDPANLTLWRMPRQRLEGELIRDSILAVSGRLNPDHGGPGVFPRLPEALGNSLKIKNFTAWEPTDGPESRKRSVYVFQRRQIENPFMAVMDAPVLQSPLEVRPVSTTALQALTLMNGRLVTEESGHFAERVVTEAGPEPADQIRRAFLLALSRPPTEKEEQDALRFLTVEKAGGLSGFCRVLLNTNEFVYVD